MVELMQKNRIWSFFGSTACVKLLVLSALLGISQGNLAQDTEIDESEIEEVVVVGTRAEPRSVTQSAVPVDVIQSDAFERQSGSDMSNLIRSVVPSFHMSDNPSRDLAALLRPVNLRGLAPDHTLVLVNNKRRHRGSVIQWISNGASNGAQGPDISSIPSVAIRQMEVLRDGAAAQYGSDAIAGVLNFQLKDSAEGRSLTVKHGLYTDELSEMQTTLAANAGFALGENGFANLSAEYAMSNPTDRSVQHGDATALIEQGISGVGDPAKPWGSPEVGQNLKLVANLGSSISDTSDVYAFGNYSLKSVETFFFFRSPMNRNGVYKTSSNLFLVAGEGCQDQYSVPSTAENVVSFRQTLTADPNCFWFGELYPEGFTPRFGADIVDIAGVAGMRGLFANDVHYDVSLSIGSNNMSGYLDNTLNPSLGPNSPRNFNIGEYTQTDTNFNVDLSKAYTLDAGVDLNVAGGFEWRNEEFEITTGGPDSYRIGPYQQYGFGTGSNGFGGFNEASAGTWDRANTAFYGDLELTTARDVTLGAAIRVEDFDGFGSTLNFKLATRLPLSENVALRGSYGTGFRAPTPGQSNARNVSTVVNAATNAFEERGTIGSTHPVAMALGGRELQPEESDNFTVGTIMELENGFTVTIDYFSIGIEDRIALSGLTPVTDEIKAMLLAQGVPEASEFTSVRYFTNDFDTATKGVDVVATKSWFASGGNNELLFTLNRTETEVTSWRPGSTITGGDTIENLERGAPGTRFGFTYRHARELSEITVRYNFYGEWYDDHSAQEFDGYGYLDTLYSRDFSENLLVTFGIENVLGAYPDESVNFGNGRKYPRYSPAGYNGRLAFASIRYEL